MLCDLAPNSLDRLGESHAQVHGAAVSVRRATGETHEMVPCAYHHILSAQWAQRSTRKSRRVALSLPESKPSYQSPFLVIPAFSRVHPASCTHRTSSTTEATPVLDNTFVRWKSTVF